MDVWPYGMYALFEQAKISTLRRNCRVSVRIGLLGTSAMNWAINV